jgi:hypothetical protein
MSHTSSPVRQSSYGVSTTPPPGSPSALAAEGRDSYFSAMLAGLSHQSTPGCQIGYMGTYWLSHLNVF